MKQHITAVNK